MTLWRNIEKLSIFIILITTPDFPHFYYMLGGNLGSLLYGDVSMMLKRDFWVLPGVGGVVDSRELLRNKVSTGIFCEEEKLRLK